MNTILDSKLDYVTIMQQYVNYATIVLHNQLQIEQLIISFFDHLPVLVGQKSGRT